jgi:hypothetical protein
MNWRAGKGNAIASKFPVRGEVPQSLLQECLDTLSPLI